jgi:hypothetical protein
MFRRGRFAGAVSNAIFRNAPISNSLRDRWGLFYRGPSWRVTSALKVQTSTPESHESLLHRYDLTCFDGISAKRRTFVTKCLFRFSRIGYKTLVRSQTVKHRADRNKWFGKQPARFCPKGGANGTTRNNKRGE